METATSWLVVPSAEYQALPLSVTWMENVTAYELPSEEVARTSAVYPPEVSETTFTDSYEALAPRVR